MYAYGMHDASGGVSAQLLVFLIVRQLLLFFVAQEVLSKWKHFNDEQRQFDQWLNEKEQVLARMRLVDMKDVNEVIEQVRQLKVCTEMRLLKNCHPHLRI